MADPVKSQREGLRPWSSRSVGSPLQHRAFHLLLRAGGLRAAYALLRPVAAWYAVFRPDVRRRGSFYLARRFPGRPALGRMTDSYRHTLALGKALVDRAAVGLLGPGTITATNSGRDRLRALIAEGRGLIMLSSHVGSWQATMPALAQLGTPVNLVIQREEGDVDRHYFELRKEASPFRIIDPQGYLGGAVEITAALRRGEVLSMMGDRVFGDSRGVLSVDFLGAPAPFPTGPYSIAAATGAPIAVLFSVKTGRTTYEMLLADVLRVPAGTGRKVQGFRPYVERYVRHLEEYTRQHPYQFFNFYDLWSDGPGSDGVFPGAGAGIS